MPIYEYECESCGNKYSSYVPSFSSSDDEVKCPECDEKKSKRLLSVNVAVGGNSFDASRSSCSSFSRGGFS